MLCYAMYSIFNKDLQIKNIGIPQIIEGPSTTFLLARLIEEQGAWPISVVLGGVIDIGESVRCLTAAEQISRLRE